jgi:hypothetical protein
LPFKTFGEAAAFDLEVEVSCRCGRRVVIDGMAPAFRDRRIMGTRFRCTTILPHGVACAGSPSIYIGKQGRRRWTMAEGLFADQRAVGQLLFRVNRRLIYSSCRIISSDRNKSPQRPVSIAYIPSLERRTWTRTIQKILTAHAAAF